MAIKYTREGYRHREPGDAERRFLARPRPVNPRQRLLIIYIGLGAAALVLFFFHLAFERPAEWREIRESVGMISAKGVLDENTPNPTYYLDITVTAEYSEAGPLTERVRTSRTEWEQFEEGQQLVVLYRLGRSGQEIRISSITPLSDSHEYSP